MSRLKELVAELEVESGFEEQEEVKKISVTGRLTEEEVWRLDYVSKRIGMSRSGFAQVLMTDGCLEAAEGLGVDSNELRCLYISEKSGRPVDEVREDMKKSGIFVTTEKGEKVNVTGIYAAGQGSVRRAK